MFRRLTGDQSGFTLTELLTAIAIVIVVAAIGIPVYLKFLTGAKHSEAEANLSGIKLFEEGYKLANGTYIDCAVSPRLGAAVDQDVLGWQDLGTGFTTIGFSTAADVRFAYAVSSASKTEFLAEARGDTDGDGDYILLVASQNEGPRLVKAGDTVTIGDTTDKTD